MGDPMKPRAWLVFEDDFELVDNQAEALSSGNSIAMCSFSLKFNCSKNIASLSTVPGLNEKSLIHW